MRGIVCAVMGLVMLVGMPTVARSETTEQRLRSLEQALKDAQQEIQRLKDEVRQQRAISQGTQTQIEAARQAQEEQAKKVVTADKLPEFLKRISIFGDLRMRHEGFYHQPAKDGVLVTARNRERLRARVGIKATLSDELSTTVRIASGNRTTRSPPTRRSTASSPRST